MKISVTGGMGFIGRHLVRYLAYDGHEVSVFDRTDGDNLLDRRAINRIFADKPDLVIHLAAQPGRIFGELDPHHTITTNTVITTNIARKCHETGTRLMYFSTSEIYGDIGQQEAIEDGPFGNRKNLYALSKWWGEEAVRLYLPFNQWTIIRPCMPYGPGMEVGPGRAALPTFIHNAMNREPLVVHRGTERGWLFIDDFIIGVVTLLDWPGVWNIASERRDPTINVAKMACDITGAPRSLINVVEIDKITVPVKRISAGKLMALGWRPHVPTVDGMKRMYLDLVERGAASEVAT